MMKIVSDTLDKDLGPQRAAEVRAAIQPDGDCAGCGRRLGNVPIRVDVQSDDTIALVTPRHAPCTPAPQEDYIALVRANTYRVQGAIVPTVRGPKPGRSFLRKQEPATSSEVMVVINPSVDVLGYFGDGLLIDSYRRRGFVDPGTAEIGNPDAARKAGITLEIDNRGMLVVNDSLGTRYEVTDVPQIVQQAKVNAGAMVAVTYARSITEITDIRSLQEVSSTHGDAVHMWVPLTKSARR